MRRGFRAELHADHRTKSAPVACARMLCPGGGPGVPARAKLRRVHEDTQPGEVALMNETVLEPKWSAIL